jgi:hypothetical protein
LVIKWYFADPLPWCNCDGHAEVRDARMWHVSSIGILRAPQANWPRGNRIFAMIPSPEAWSVYEILKRRKSLMMANECHPFLSSTQN